VGHLHFGLPILCNCGILPDHLYGGVCSADTADQCRKLDAMRWSRETSTTCRRSRADVQLRFEHRPSVRATRKGPRTLKTAFGLLQAASGPADRRSGRQSARPAARGTPNADGLGVSNAELCVGGPLPSADPGSQGRFMAFGASFAPGDPRRAFRRPVGCGIGTDGSKERG